MSDGFGGLSRSPGYFNTTSVLYYLRLLSCMTTKYSVLSKSRYGCLLCGGRLRYNSRTPRGTFAQILSHLHCRHKNIWSKPNALSTFKTFAFKFKPFAFQFRRSKVPKGIVWARCSSFALMTLKNADEVHLKEIIEFCEIYFKNCRIIAKKCKNGERTGRVHMDDAKIGLFISLLLPRLSFLEQYMTMFTATYVYCVPLSCKA